MKIGIIAEYNPFHNGHIKQIEWIKKNYNNPEIIVVLTDQFTQRGDMHLLSFSKREKICKKYGISKVLKLNFEESMQAAHIYAQNAISKLNDENIDILVFGSETQDIKNMIKNAQVIKSHEKDFYNEVKLIMKKEKTSYPKAVNIVLQNWNLKQFIEPNDILGYEYVKVIIDNNYPIKPVAMKREVGFYSFKTKGNIASATYIREMIEKNEDVSFYTPIKLPKEFKKLEDYYQKYVSILPTLTKKQFDEIPLISEGIENLLLKNIQELNLKSYLEKCTSKRYTTTRIKRIICWILYKFSYK